jgi:hypothetical protein
MTSIQVEILNWRLPTEKVKYKPLGRDVQEREKHIHETFVEFCHDFCKTKRNNKIWAMKQNDIASLLA